MKLESSKRLYGLACLFLLGIYLALACYKIDRPGLQYDELLFVNAARGVLIPDLFVWKKLFGIPVLLMSYIGRA